MAYNMVKEILIERQETHVCFPYYALYLYQPHLSLQLRVVHLEFRIVFHDICSQKLFQTPILVFQVFKTVENKILYYLVYLLSANNIQK